MHVLVVGPRAGSVWNSVLTDTALAPRGRAVRVALHPGWVRTDMGAGSADLARARSVADMRRTLAAWDKSHTFPAAALKGLAALG